MMTSGTLANIDAIEWEESEYIESHGKIYATLQEKKKHEKRRHAARVADARPFIAWDGEGITKEDGTHVYTLLANSLGGYIAARDIDHPLTTKQCFRFILNTAHANPGANHVWFAFGYDVNMMLGDVSEDDLRVLYERDGAWTYLPSVQMHVMFRPKKTFAIRARMQNPGTGEYVYWHVKMDDTFTFFGTSFLTACDTYLCCTVKGHVHTWPDRELVQKGKLERATGFNNTDVIEYNKAELRALVLTMNELRSQLSYVGIHPRDWHGPGAVASKLLMYNGVKEHMATPPKSVDRPLRHSYAGGRFELVRYGSTREPTWRYDKRSAYPHAATLLPTMQGKWRHSRKVTGVKPLGLYRVQWDAPYDAEQYPQPFHYRREDGMVCFPPHVQGWYWGDEVLQALRLPYGECQLLEAYVFTPANDVHPFAFEQEIYDERRRLIAEGHPAQLALKLAINSVYGKLIQQIGWKEKDGVRSPPTYFSLFAASRITSVTRASLMQMVIDNEGYEDVISFETDAIFTSRRWENIEIGEKLGQWEEKELHNLVYIQSGVYACDEIPHVRGMTRMVWPTDPVGAFRHMIETRWEPYEYTLNAFVGLGTGLTQDMDKWRHWIDIPRKLQTMEPSLGLAKRNHDMLSCDCQDDDDAQLDMWHRTRIWPQVYEGGIQRAYDLAWEGPTREVFDPSELEATGAYWE
jgi:DNA polymerase type B, organellar and viral